jgi:hypothetical protein
MELLRSIVLEYAPGHSTQLVDLTLKEIVDAGKVTNNYQLFVLAHVSEFFKNGLKSVDLQLENPISFNTHATHSYVVDTLKAMTDEEHVALAEYLLDCIKAGECARYDRDSKLTDWMRFVLRKQD